MLTIDKKIAVENDAELVQSCLHNRGFDGFDDNERTLAVAAITRLRARLTVLKNKSELFKNITLSSNACELLQ